MPHSQHRRLEESLDCLPPPSDNSFPAVFEALLDRILEHYAAEESAFPGPRFAKMRAQHDDARELGAEVVRSLDIGHPEDAARLLMRFLALVRHNMIEEERDVFPYYHQE